MNSDEEKQEVRRQPPEQGIAEGNGGTYREDPEENRAMLIFVGKPSEEIRRILKSRAFKRFGETI